MNLAVECDVNAYLDACTTGLGAIYETQVYVLPLPKDWQASNIASLEIINILVALNLHWSGDRVLIHCDNQAMVSVLNTGKSRDTFCLRLLVRWLGTYSCG